MIDFELLVVGRDVWLSLEKKLPGHQIAQTAVARKRGKESRQ